MKQSEHGSANGGLNGHTAVCVPIALTLNISHDRGASPSRRFAACVGELMFDHRAEMCCCGLYRDIDVIAVTVD